jgi:hypothetical protein
VRDVDPCPLAAQFFRRVNSRAAAAKRIKHNMAFIGTCADDTL